MDTYRVILRFELLEQRDVPSTIQVFDERGINILAPAPAGQNRAVVHNLTGAGVQIGQYESGRVGHPAIDGVSNNKIVANTVYEIDQPAQLNNAAVTGGGGHSTSVAGLMIATQFPVQNDGVANVAGVGSVSFGIAPQSQLLAASGTRSARYPADLRFRRQANPNETQAQSEDAVVKRLSEKWG
jgi:hypothetical protein